MAQSRRKKISIFFIIVLIVLLLPTALFIFASYMVSSVSLPQGLAAPPLKRLDFVFGPAPTGAPRPSDTKTTTSPTASPVSKASAPTPPSSPSRPEPSPGGRIWLELVRENSRIVTAGVNPYDNQCGQVFPDNQYFTVPLTKEQIRWIQSQSRLIDQLIRVSESGRFSLWNDADLLHLQNPEKDLFKSSYQFNGSFLDLLGKHALWRRQEKDYAGAGRSLLAALRLSDMFDQNIYVADYLYFPAVEPYLHAAIRDTDWPGDQIKTLQDELARIEERRFPRNGIVRKIANMYLGERETIIWEMNRATWKSFVYGYDLDRNVTKYWGPLPFGPTNRRALEIPHPIRMLTTSLAAMRNKTRAAEALRQYDEAWLQLVEASRKPYPEWRAVRSRLSNIKQMHDNFLFTEPAYGFGTGNSMFSIRFHDPTTPVRMEQARVHLSRLGLRWRLDPKGTLAARKEGELSGNPYDTWRDPFTERPLLLDTPTSPTLIYSIGSDLIDQHGTELVDTNNPFATKGDIIIRLPQR